MCSVTAVFAHCKVQSTVTSSCSPLRFDHQRFFHPNNRPCRLLFQNIVQHNHATYICFRCIDSMHRTFACAVHSQLEEDLGDDYKWSYRVHKVMYSGQSEYQAIDLVDTPTWGKVLLLDGKMQSTEADELFYHELLVHPALLHHPNPRTVFIMGGEMRRHVRALPVACIPDHTNILRSCDCWKFPCSQVEMMTVLSCAVCIRPSSAVKRDGVEVLAATPSWVCLHRSAQYVACAHMCV